MGALKSTGPWDTRDVRKWGLAGVEVAPWVEVTQKGGYLLPGHRVVNSSFPSGHSAMPSALDPANYGLKA